MRSRHSVAWQSWKLINFSFSNKKTCSLLSAEARCIIVTKVGHVRVCAGNHAVTALSCVTKFENWSIFRFQTKNLSCGLCELYLSNCGLSRSDRHVRMCRKQTEKTSVLDGWSTTCVLFYALVSLAQLNWHFHEYREVPWRFNESIFWILGGPTALSPEVSIKV